ncbi:hypothetical protein PND20_06005, partial [Ligilactobacillus ruminis]|uniref:hypothetical protein n=1 Tax=Ligilactobacillus ruminis TaxID=1623 RepID=UPI00232B90E6
VLIIYIFLPILEYITGLSSRNAILHITLAHLPTPANHPYRVFSKNSSKLLISMMLKNRA